MASVRVAAPPEEKPQFPSKLTISYSPPTVTSIPLTSSGTLLMLISRPPTSLLTSESATGPETSLCTAAEPKTMSGMASDMSRTVTLPVLTASSEASNDMFRESSAINTTISYAALSIITGFKALKEEAP